MVEGDLASITLNHVVVTYVTCYKAVIIYCFCVLFFKEPRCLKTLLLQVYLHSSAIYLRILRILAFRGQKLRQKLFQLSYLC